MKFFDAMILIGLLGAEFLADNLDFTTIQYKLTKFVAKALDDIWMTTCCLIHLPIENNLGIDLIHVLSAGPGTTGVGKMEFGKRYFNMGHTCYHCSMKSNPWFVYIIQNEKGHYYCGITTDLERRFKEHSESKKGAKFFHTGAPVEMVFKKKFANRSLATKYEIAVKKMTRDQKIALISKKR